MWPSNSGNNYERKEENNMKIKDGVLLSISTSDIKDGHAKIPHGVTHIGADAFYGCTGLTSLTFPDTLTHIGAGAFRGCTGLTSVTFPDTLTHIGDWAFRGCTGLTSLTFLHHKSHDTYKCLVADGILCFVKRKRAFNNEIEYYKCQMFNGMRNKELLLEDCAVVEQDGYFAHGKEFRQAMRDLQFKLSKSRGAEQYREYGVEHRFTVDEAAAMYRVITGACAMGVEQFIRSQGELKDDYSPRDIIEITAGHYGYEAFREFWEG